MLSVTDTEAIILNLVQPLDNTEVVDLLAATGRILATPVISKLDFPHWDNSAMDGYAVRFEDVQNAREDAPAILQIVEEIPAGYQPKSIIQRGQAARIFTGAVIPQGADTVIMQERTRREANRVFILTAPKPQEFVRHKASYYQAGTELLPAGIILNAAEIAILAAAQCAEVTVYRRPRVAIFSTGDELVTPDQPLQPGQIVDSNQYALAALVKQSGAEPIILGIVKDEPVTLEKTITHAIANADLVISSGGVSVGDYDYVEKILESLGAKIHIQSVAMRPGKPLTVASFPRRGDGGMGGWGDGENFLPQHSPLSNATCSTWGDPKTAVAPQNSELSTHHSPLYFGLPGNPAAVLVTFWRFVQPAIKKLGGMSADWEVKFEKVRSHDELRSDGKRETYVWGSLKLIDGVYEFHQAGGSHSSGNLINLAQSNALAVLRVGTTLITSKQEVEVLKIYSNFH